jgi:hypothetical protein
MCISIIHEDAGPLPCVKPSRNKDKKRRRSLRIFSADITRNVLEIEVSAPFVSRAVRTLVDLMEGAIVRKNMQGGLQMRTFNDLLRDKRVVDCFGTDSSFYFGILLTDQRGWNMRNEVCHGVSPVGVFN